MLKPRTGTAAAALTQYLSDTQTQVGAHICGAHPAQVTAISTFGGCQKCLSDKSYHATHALERVCVQLCVCSCAFLSPTLNLRRSPAWCLYPLPTPSFHAVSKMNHRNKQKQSKWFKNSLTLNLCMLEAELLLSDRCLGSLGGCAPAEWSHSVLWL